MTDQQASGSRNWIDILDGVTRERLIRECRREIVLKDLRLAALRAAALFNRAETTQRLREDALALGAGLAELHNDRDRAEQVVAALLKAEGNAGQGAALLAEQFARLVRETRQTGFQTGEQAYFRQLNEALFAIRDVMPTGNEVGEPSAEQLDRVYQEFKAIAGAGLGRRRMEDFIDTLLILQDYCPTDGRAIESLAGVEDRSFMQLGPRAKLTSVRALVRLGESETLRQALLTLAQSEEGGRRIELIANVMGGLQHADFYPWLSQTLKKIDASKRSRAEDAVVEGLGRIGNRQAAVLLIERLRACAKKLPEPAQEDRACMLLTSLGRLGRGRNMPVLERNDMVRESVQMLSRAGRRVAFHAASSLIAVKAGDLEPDLRAWGARKIVDALWGQPYKNPIVFRGVPLGWRSEMANALKRLGKETLPEVIEAAQPHATEYSGAMVALASALEEIGDERACPLVESMIRTALLHNPEEKQTSYLTRERVADAASGEVQELDRDDMIQSLLYSLKQFGGEEGLGIVLDFADQLQAGRLPLPGEKTAQILLDTKIQQGKLGQITRKAEATQVDPEAYEAALRDARGGLLIKKPRQIAAIATLGSARLPDSVGVLTDLLGDKDPMTAGAAHTALACLMHPLPSESEFAAVLDRIFENPKKLKGKTMDGLMEFIRREVPKNPPYDKIFARQLAINIDDEAQTHQLNGAFRFKPESSAAAAKAAAGPGAPDSAAEPGEKPAGISALDRRMAQMQARREWLAGGRKGPEPKVEG